MDERKFRDAVSRAWEEIAPDCGSTDGEGALDHLEAIFFHLGEDSSLDRDTRDRVLRFDPELKRWAREELKKYG